MSIIVVEGPDGAGKTTLMENVRAAAGRRYFVMLRHSCRPLTEEDALAFNRSLWAISDQGLTCIVDRHAFVSEPIYGPILRGHSLVDGFSADELGNMLKDSVSKIIYCRPPIHVIKENLSKQPQLAGIFEKIDQIVEGYDKRMRTLQLRYAIPVVYYDWTQKKDVIETVFGGNGR
jgi:hypothetical protein